jgi:hypothetical protein
MRLLIRLCSVAAIVSASSLYAEEVSAPNAEFLEFLGEWQTSDGQWQDPTDLLFIDESDLQNANEQPVEEQDHDE